MLRQTISAILRPILRSPLEAGVGGAVDAFSAAKFAIQQDAADVNILVIGDSTGDASNEWVYLFGQWLASEHSTHSVSYRLWNNGSNVYDAAVLLGAGSGSNTIRIWNASIAGALPRTLSGSKFAPAIVDVAPDLVVWNHGHNIVAAYNTHPTLARGMFIEAMDEVRLALPGVPHAALLQNPWRDGSDMNGVIATVEAIAGDYGDLTLVDVHARFVAAGKPSGWYTDNTHPNATGQAEILATVTDKWGASAAAASFDPVAAFLATAGTNLLVNSNFSDAAYVGGTPTGWGNTGVTATVETTIVDSGKSQSMKMASTGASSNLRRDVTNLAALQGNSTTFAVRQYIPAGSASTVGRISLLYTDGGNTSVTTQAYGGTGQAGWRWSVIAGLEIPATATLVRAYIYSDTAASAGSTVYVDRAILVAGDVPRDLA